MGGRRRGWSFAYSFLIFEFFAVALPRPLSSLRSPSRRRPSGGREATPSSFFPPPSLVAGGDPLACCLSRLRPRWRRGGARAGVGRASGGHFRPVRRDGSRSSFAEQASGYVRAEVAEQAGGEPIAAAGAAVGGGAVAEPSLVRRMALLARYGPS